MANKRWCFVIAFAVIALIVVSGCGKQDAGEKNLAKNTATNADELTETENVNKEKPEPAEKEIENMTEAELAALFFERAWIHEGNPVRIASALKKAQTGGQTTIAFLGGSITWGANASDNAKTSYPALVRDWWQETFPEARIQYVNAGIPATDSLYGTARAEKDIIQKEPDIVVVEFGVNDSTDNSQLNEVFEGLIRRLLEAETQPGIIILENMRNDHTNSEEVHLPVAEYYDIPVLSYRQAISPELKEGRMKWEDLYGDLIHPNDRGHYYLSQLVILYLETVRAQLDQIDTATIPDIPAEPKFSGRFTDAKMLEASYSLFTPGTWQIDGKGWKSNVAGGKPLKLKTEASFVALRFNGDNGKGYALVNGKRFELDKDANDHFWYGNWWPQPVLVDEPSPVPVEIEVHLEEGSLGIYEFIASGFAKSENE